MKFTTIDRILAALRRDIPGEDFAEGDIVEWVGEALGFLQSYNVLEEKVLFQEVKQHKLVLPDEFQYVLELRKGSEATLNLLDNCEDPEVEDTLEELQPVKPVMLDCKGNPVDKVNIRYFNPSYNLQTEYYGWKSRSTATFPRIKLADRKFLNSEVFKDDNYESLYKDCKDTYTINNGTLIFSFKEGLIILSYLGVRLDDNGLPMIPDHSSAISAITYYIKWKISEGQLWNNREGSATKVKYYHSQYLSYIRSFKNYSKMPKTKDEYDNLMLRNRNTNLGRFLTQKYR